MTRLRLLGSGLDWREVDGQVIALDSRHSKYLATNATGTVLWRALAAGSSEDELALLLVDTYAIEPERARLDVSRFLAGLGENGMLEAG